MENDTSDNVFLFFPFFLLSFRANVSNQTRRRKYIATRVDFLLLLFSIKLKLSLSLIYSRSFISRIIRKIVDWSENLASNRRQRKRNIDPIIVLIIVRKGRFFETRKIEKSGIEDFSSSSSSAFVDSSTFKRIRSVDRTRCPPLPSAGSCYETRTSCLSFENQTANIRRRKI